MKKIMIMAVGVVLAAATHAAAVGWQLAGANAYAGDAYQFYIIGQKGVESIATITALLDAGSSVDSYVFGSGKVSAAGAATVTATTAGQPTISDAGTYTSFFVVFDTADLTPGTTKYAVVSGSANLTKSISASSATVTFQAGNASSALSNATWNTYAAPEPTSGLLMLLGVAGLALRRKRA